MLVVETIAKIRRAYFVQGKAIKEICRELRVSRKVVRKVIRTNATEFHYERSQQPLPRIGPWREQLETLLGENDSRAPRERLTLIGIFEELRALGYGGSYAAVRRYAIAWREKRASTTVDAYVPLTFSPGEAYQFDWSHELALIGRRDDDAEGGACPAVPQPNDVRARLSAREPGDGVRRARTRLRVLQGRLRARDLRQHENGGRYGVRRQGPAIQSPLPADVLASSGRAGRLHAGFGMGERSGREPGRACPGAVLRAPAAVQDL